MVFNIDVSRKDYPCFWEEGGGTNKGKGKAVIVAGPNGEKKKPLHIRTKGNITCGKHALIRVKPGYILVIVDRHNVSYSIKVYRIEAIDLKNKTAKVSCFVSSDLYTWETNTALKKYRAAIKAAIAKSNRMYCRFPYYVLY